MVMPDSLVGQVKEHMVQQISAICVFNSASRLLALMVRRGEALGVMDASTSSVPYFIASSFFKQPEACNAEKLFVNEIQGHIVLVGCRY